MPERKVVLVDLGDSMETGLFNCSPCTALSLFINGLESVVTDGIVPRPMALSALAILYTRLHGPPTGE